MKTKLIALTAVITGMAFSAKAQNKTTFGVRAGVNFQNVTWKDPEGDEIETKLKTGFHVGVNAEIPVAPEFYVQPGVLYSTKGGKTKIGRYEIRISYIEIPINFLYKPVLGKGKLLLGIGPYVAIGIAGQVKFASSSSLDIRWQKEVTMDDYWHPELNLKRFDAGGNLLFGYEFSNRFSAQLNAQLGLLNIQPKVTDAPNDKSKFKNTGFGISVGYRF